jgi:sugar phosphate isomerase/epimerase
VYTVLSTPRLLFDSSPERTVELAVRHGFDGIAAPLPFVRAASDAQRTDLGAAVRDAGLRFGPATFPVPIGTTTTDDAFAGLLIDLPYLCRRLTHIDATTMSTWIAPGNDEADTDATFALHVDRLNRLSPVLEDAGMRLGLEYVGPVTWRAGKRFEFISTLAGLRALIAAVDRPETFGLVLDTFHWYTAAETVSDIAALGADDVIGVDLNDAPLGIPVDEQLDMERAQPGATGVIDIDGFCGALLSIGYEGPVQAEPFSTGLQAQPEEDRVSEAREGLRRFIGH